MATAPPLLLILRETIIGLIHEDQADLSARQLAVLLVSSLDDGPHTVRGLAAQLSMPKQSITRALNRLEELELVKRIVDPLDRRSLNVIRTRAGDAYVERLRTIMTGAAVAA